MIFALLTVVDYYGRHTVLGDAEPSGLGRRCHDLSFFSAHTLVASDIVSLLIAIRQMLIDNGARVDLRSSSGEYAEDEATAAMFRTARILHDRSLPRAVGSFNGKYECYSPTVHDRPDMENTGKMLLPPSALEELAQDPHIDLPWLFCLMAENGARAYCGVQEFVAPEGKAFVPGWVIIH